MTVTMADDVATPDALGAPGQEPTYAVHEDSTADQFADASFYCALGGFLMPAAAFAWIAMSGSVIAIVAMVTLMLLGPAAIVSGVLAQRRPTARWRHGTAWAGLFGGTLDFLFWATFVAIGIIF